MKKVSLFLTTPVRKRMEGDSNFARSPVFLKAIKLHHELVEAGLTRGLSDKEAQSVGGAAWKFFSQCHCESDAVQRYIKEAWRIESTVGFSLPESLSLKVEINFFGKSGDRKFMPDLTIWIDSHGVAQGGMYNSR
jgi:hypothetical protein